MSKSPNQVLLARAAQLASDFLDGLPARPVGVRADRASLAEALGGRLPEKGRDPLAILDHLVAAADPGIVASAGPRYFGHVISGAHPAALAADWLTAAWDQNAVLYATSPANAVIEEVVGKWLADLFGLAAPGREISVGFVSGCQMAHVTALLAARHHVLMKAGWDVERQGLFGAPPIRVFCGAEAHGSVATALQYIGLGRDQAVIIPSDEQGRMRADLLARAIEQGQGPAIICAQAGGVNTGAFDPFVEIADIAARQGAWLHIDGAFGLWAAVASEHRHLTAGMERADSWATDGHKWLNVPHDSGIVLTAHPAAHRAAMSMPGEAYLHKSGETHRDPYQWVPEMSRRARAIAIYAALLGFGRDGLAELVARCCRLARRMRDHLAAAEGVSILNDVVLNQVLVQVTPRDDDIGDQITDAVIAAIQAEGTCWLGGTTWRGRRALRISICNYRTTDADIDRSAAAILEQIEGIRR
ncbi:MAG: aspartate aminotransferase family protein [Rhodospirillaceae bacterium]|nr:MAG: aspartate aminotransferase family protein [Rhodospirillaceae bacterium]